MANPTGTLTTTPQGFFRDGHPQGSGLFNPFAVGDPVLILDASKGLSFNGSLEERFETHSAIY